MRAALAITGLSFTWPDGSTVFDDFDLAVGPGRHGLVGRNGCGKSTLLRLIAGDLPIQAGTVNVDGSLAYLPQNLISDPGRTVADLLGVAEVLAALERMDAGDVRTDDFDVIGNDWDIAERTTAELGRLGLDHITLDRTADTVSGGELVLLSLTALLLRRPSVLLLDEPTNNLDLATKRKLIDVISTWRGTLLVVSHDRELLNVMDDIGELRQSQPAGMQIRWYGGGYDDFEAAVAAEQQVAERAVRTAEADVRAQKRELVEAQTKLARSARQGRKQAEGLPKILAGARKRAAQETAGRVTGTHKDRLADANDQLTEAEARLRDDREVHIDLPETAVPPGRKILQAMDLRPQHGSITLDLELRGPERIGLTGANGAGKTSLLRTIIGELEPAAGTVDVFVPWRYLPQRMNLLDDSLTVAENIALIAPEATETDRRSRLARFLFRGRAADQLAATLSGGERLRATLACLLLAEPAPQLLVLDEPTNNLDLPSLRHLVEALRTYRGALLVVSHDEPFLAELELTRRIDL